MKREPFYAGLGARLRTARELLGLSQAAVGHRMRPIMSRASIANIESGSQRVLAHQLPTLSRAVNSTVAYLVGAP